jgi:hypothetical protein
MTTLQEAAQQALEALQQFTYASNPAITTLRAALAQQDEPVAKVELMTTGGNAGLATRIVEIDDHLRERLRPGQLLYTAPPQRKPLTEGQISALLMQAAEQRLSAQAFARAVEAAHGIGKAAP